MGEVVVTSSPKARQLYWVREILASFVRSNRCDHKKNSPDSFGFAAAAAAAAAAAEFLGDFGLQLDSASFAGDLRGDFAFG